MVLINRFIIPLVSLALLAPSFGADSSQAGRRPGDSPGGANANQADNRGGRRGDDRRGGGGGGGRRGRNDRGEKVKGVYRVMVRGFYNGDGKAVVTPTSVKIKANVEDENGRKGRLDANLTVSNNRFHGEGTLMGGAVILEGRMDAPDAPGRPVVKIARFVCTFRAADGHRGRISGERTGGGNGNGD